MDSITKGWNGILRTTLVVLVVILKYDRVSAGEYACKTLGGKCVFTYLGCEDGRFRRGVCDGPSYNQCCVREGIVVETKDVEKQCYSCEYVVVDGKVSGSRYCLDPFMIYLCGHGVTTVKCMGSCTKEWTQYDENNYSLVRRCLPDCQDFSSPDYSTHCCKTELCNRANKNAPLFHTIFIVFICNFLTFVTMKSILLR